MNAIPYLSRLIDRLQENSWPAQLLPALGLASVVTGYGISAFCSGSLSEGQNSSWVLSTRLVPTQLHCTETPPTASAVSCGLSLQPQDSKLAPVNSFCICQSLRRSGQAGNLTCQVGAPSIASPVLPSLSIKHSFPQGTVLGRGQYAILSKLKGQPPKSPGRVSTSQAE